MWQLFVKSNSYSLRFVARWVRKVCEWDVTEQFLAGERGSPDGLHISEAPQCIVAQSAEMLCGVKSYRTNLSSLELSISVNQSIELAIQSLRCIRCLSFRLQKF
jgi:hypothetical protein